MNKLYNIEKLSLNYGEKKILKNISFEIPRALVALIGPNGSGKTSLLRVLAGLNKKYSGNVTLNNHEVKNISRKNFSRTLSFVMSNKNFRPSYSFSVREIIALGRLPFTGMFGRMTAHDLELIERAAELLKVSHLLDRDIMTLSDGERQLVFIAAALAQDTEIILLDEPTASLDPDKAAQVFTLLKKLSNEGRGIITAIHDINIASAHSDFYVAIKNGELIYSGEGLNQKNLRNLYGVDFVLDLMWKVKYN